MAADQPPLNYYDILGVAPSATTEGIKVAYRARVASYHPDRNPSTHANAITALVNEAWDVLGNPDRRRQYDATMGFSEWSAPREGHQENDSSKNTSNTVPPSGTSRSQPNAAIQQSTSSAAAWSVRILGLLLVGATVVFTWLGGQSGNYHYKGWFVLLFYVCLLSTIYWFRRSGQSEFFYRLFRWPARLFRWFAIGLGLLFSGELTFVAFTADDNKIRVIAGTLAIVAVCFAEYLSGHLMARAAARWLGAALIRLGVMLEVVVNRVFGRTQQEAMAQAQAVQDYRNAAEHGNAFAQFILGVAYAEGQGLPQDYTQAVQWWSKAAEQGHVDAQSNIAWAYANGRGVPQDDARAAQWLRKAAEQGHPESQFGLGWGYENGRGVPQDYVEAHNWMNLAAARTSGADQKRLAEGRDAVAKKMTPDQLSEAQKRAREWMETLERKP